MTDGAVAVHGAGDFGHLIDPNRRWNNNKRFVLNQTAACLWLTDLVSVQAHRVECVDYAFVRLFQVCSRFVLTRVGQAHHILDERL